MIVLSFSDIKLKSQPFGLKNLPEIFILDYINPALFIE